MSTKTTSPRGSRLVGTLVDRSLPRSLVQPLVVFLLTFFALFVGMTRHPYIYDEGLVLTAAMRVAAGQLPHRDFYELYGPAQFYLLAGLFKIFGPSLLVERLFDLLVKSFLVTLCFQVLSSCCRFWITAGSCLLVLFWLFGLPDLVGTPVIPVSLLNLLAVVLVLPAFVRALSPWSLFAAGAVAGVTTLFRYDTGIALFFIEILTLGIASYWGRDPRSMKQFFASSWPLCLGAAAAIVPALLFFLSVAPFGSFLQDVVGYPSHYYRRARGLPFPRIYFKQLEILEVYLPILTAAIAVLVAAVFPVAEVEENTQQDPAADRTWQGMLVTFALLTGVMYLKGFVRVSLGQMYLSIIPSLLLLALLLEKSSALQRSLRWCIGGLAALSLVAGTWLALHQVIGLYRFHVGMPSSVRLAQPEIEQWCQTQNPLTKGICFLPEDDRIRAIEFITRHTVPGQLLYSGTRNHQTIFANDNIIYFATQRLPATHWSHFDPGLQNTYGIQTQIVQELQATAPPYAVLESEFERTREPNESSRSSGVRLLDDYLHSRYHYVTHFGTLAIWQRN